MNCVICIGRSRHDVILGDIVVCWIKSPDSADATEVTDRCRITAGGGVGG